MVVVALTLTLTWASASEGNPPEAEAPCSCSYPGTPPEEGGAEARTSVHTPEVPRTHTVASDVGAVVVAEHEDEDEDGGKRGT